VSPMHVQLKTPRLGVKKFKKKIIVFKNVI
jgi:hypothetical protein